MSSRGDRRASRFLENIEQMRRIEGDPSQYARGYKAGHKDGYKQALDDVRDLLDIPLGRERVNVIPSLLPKKEA